VAPGNVGAYDSVVGAPGCDTEKRWCVMTVWLERQGVTPRNVGAV